MTSFQNAELFNCCPGDVAPDWSQFDRLELGGCVEDRDEDTGEGNGYTIGGIERDQAEFFTVYGHIPGGGIEAITDIREFGRAVEVLKHLRLISGLDFEIYC